MLEPSPTKRIDLAELLDFVQTYDREQQTKRIVDYKKRAKKSLPYFSVFGSVAAPFFSINNFIQNDNSPQNLDLRMCVKLIQEIKC